MTGQLTGTIGLTRGVVDLTRQNFAIRVKRYGRVRMPNLADPQLVAIGQRLVAEQKARWLRSYNANGVSAKKLTVRYAIIKQAITHKRAKRDMVMTGTTMANFALRKAKDGIVRAENTTKLERDKAKRANNYDQMIGMALSDVKVAMDESRAQYGEYVATAWIPLDGVNRRPSVLPPRPPPTPAVTAAGKARKSRGPRKKP